MHLTNLLLTLQGVKLLLFEIIKYIHLANLLWVLNWPSYFFIGHPISLYRYMGWFKKSCSIKVEKKCNEKWRWKLSTCETTLRQVFFQKKNFHILIYIVDMAIWMSNLVNFDIFQISSKFAQRYHLVCNFDCKNVSILGSLDNAENRDILSFNNSSFFTLQKLS